jgi:methyltransferase family protein
MKQPQLTNGENMTEMYEGKKVSKAMTEFHEMFPKLLEMDFSRADLVHMYPIFSGHLNLARHLSLYEMYRKTEGVLGHIADVGVWKGASFFFFIKLVEIFESRNLTQVHGFDWFKGMTKTSELDNPNLEGLHKEATLKQVQQCLEIQKLDHVGFVHDVDLNTELPSFFADNPSLTFKLVFLDCGSHEPLRQSIEHFWSRLNRGGIMILDHANDSRVAVETLALREYFGEALKIQTIPFCGWPAGYIVKE